MRHTSAVVQTVLFALVSLALSAPVSAYGTPSTPVKAPILTVHIKDYKYTPKAVTVHVGDTVAFVNDDDETHTVTVDGTFDSNGLEEKARFSYTFTKPGTYYYHCKIHASMKGSIVVVPSVKAS